MSVVTCNATAVRFSILLCVAHKLIPTLVKKLLLLLLLSFESKCQKNKARRVETSENNDAFYLEHRRKTTSTILFQRRKAFSSQVRFEGKKKTKIKITATERFEPRSRSDSQKTLELLRQGIRCPEAGA